MKTKKDSKVNERKKFLELARIIKINSRNFQVKKSVFVGCEVSRRKVEMLIREDLRSTLQVTLVSYELS